MPKKERAELMELTSIAQLKAMAEPIRLSLMEAIGDGRSVTEVAEILDVPRTRLYHHIKVLEENGLIRVQTTRKAGAIDEKIYETSAMSYKIAPDVAETADPIEAVTALLSVVFDTTRADLHRSLLRGFAEEGEPFKEKFGMGRSIGMMTEEAASKLKEELEALVNKYCSLEDEPGSKKHAVLWTIYPSAATLE